MSFFRLEVNMTNEDYIRKSKELATSIIKADQECIKAVKDILKELTIPSVGVSFASKLNELLDTFQKSPTPLDKQIIVQLESEYLLLQTIAYSKLLREYINDFVDALEKNDKTRLEEIYNQKERIESSLISIDAKISDFDFSDELVNILKAGLYKEVGLSEEEIKRKCEEELKNVNYVPPKPKQEMAFSDRHTRIN